MKNVIINIVFLGALPSNIYSAQWQAFFTRSLEGQKLEYGDSFFKGATTIHLILTKIPSNYRGGSALSFSPEILKKLANIKEEKFLSVEISDETGIPIDKIIPLSVITTHIKTDNKHLPIRTRYNTIKIVDDSGNHLSYITEKRSSH